MGAMPKRDAYDRDGKGKFRAGPTHGENLGLRLPLALDQLVRARVCSASQTPQEQRAAIRQWLIRLTCEALEIPHYEAMEPPTNDPATRRSPDRSLDRPTSNSDPGDPADSPAAPPVEGLARSRRGSRRRKGSSD
jgi:hypothetical protein